MLAAPRSNIGNRGMTPSGMAVVALIFSPLALPFLFYRYTSRRAVALDTNSSKCA